MQRLPMKRKVAMVLPYLQSAGLVSDPPPCSIAESLALILQAAADRIKVAGDILDYPEMFVTDDQLESCPSFDAQTLDQTVHAFVEAEQIKIEQIIHALRIALTGKSVGFGMFETMSILGREKCLNRIARIQQRTTNC
jgi:glutamyl-tRNA synthetase